MESIRRVGVMVGFVYQAVATGLTPSSAFFMAAHMLRAIEVQEGSLGERNHNLEAFIGGMLGTHNTPPPG